MTDLPQSFVNRSLLIADANLYEKYLTECLAAQKDGTWKPELTLTLEMAIRGLLLDIRTALKGNDYNQEEMALLTLLQDALKQLPLEPLNPNKPTEIMMPEPFLNVLDKATSLRDLVRQGQKS